MKLRHHVSFTVTALSCLFAFPVTCNSLFKKSAPADTKELPYEYVEVVGSSIPQRVVKGQRPVLDAPVTVVSGEVWTDAMQKSQGTVTRRTP